MARAPARPEPVAVRFRREIEQAESKGWPRAGMTLRLTLGDVNRLRRDPTIAVADISFAGGAMTYLGIPIVQGGVAESSLDCGEA